jgi:hypothetical protein
MSQDWQWIQYSEAQASAYHKLDVISDFIEKGPPFIDFHLRQLTEWYSF